MNCLDLVRLVPLMEQTVGRSEIIIGLIDGPVVVDHPALNSENIRGISSESSGVCTVADSTACQHGTFVAGILSAKRGFDAPAICPNCTMLVRSIFTENKSGNGAMPSANPKELAAALIDTIHAGARVINLSAALAQPSMLEERQLEESLDYAARHDVLIIAAAGNQGTVGSTVITRHPWVIPVAACDERGYPLSYSNLGHSIGRQGLRAPGDKIVSLGTDGNSQTISGTSAAAPFVTGAIALLYSIFPTLTAAEIKSAVMRASATRRSSVFPPLLDAWAAYQNLAQVHSPQITHGVKPID